MRAHRLQILTPDVEVGRAGKPASRVVDAPGPKGVEGVEKLGAGIMLLCALAPLSPIA